MEAALIYMSPMIPVAFFSLPVSSEAFFLMAVIFVATPSSSFEFMRNTERGCARRRRGGDEDVV